MRRHIPRSRRVGQATSFGSRIRLAYVLQLLDAHLLDLQRDSTGVAGHLDGRTPLKHAAPGARVGGAVEIVRLCPEHKFGICADVFLAGVGPLGEHESLAHPKSISGHAEGASNIHHNGKNILDTLAHKG